MLEQIFGQGRTEPDRVERIITLTERMQRIDNAVSQIKYNNDLLLEIPEAIKTLGDAKDAVIAELKTV